MLLRYFLAVVVLFSPPVRGDCSEVLLQAIWNNCTETNNTNATNTGSADGACDVNASLRVNETLQCLDLCGVKYCADAGSDSTGTERITLAFVLGTVSVFLLVCLLISFVIVCKLCGDIKCSRSVTTSQLSTSINEAYGIMEDARSGGVLDTSYPGAVAHGSGDAVEDDEIVPNGESSYTSLIPDVSTEQEAVDTCTNDDVYTPVNTPSPSISDGESIDDGDGEYSYTEARFATQEKDGNNYQPKGSITVGTNIAYSPVAVRKRDKPPLKKRAITRSAGDIISTPTATTPSFLTVPQRGKKAVKSIPSVFHDSLDNVRGEGENAKNRVNALAEEFEQRVKSADYS